MLQPTNSARLGGRIALMALLLTALAATPAQGGSQAELKQWLAELLAWWPGEYDTLPQVDAERRLGAPPDGEHDRQYRRFVRIDVPHIGPNVIYGEIHVGGKDGDIIPGQQVLYIMSIDTKRHGINVSGRRILNGPQFRLQDHTPEKLRQMQIDPNVGGNCDFLWRREGGNLVAHLANLNANDTTCTMVSKTSGNKMTWDAEWILTPNELSVFDNGYLHDKENPNRPPRLFAGREDRAPEVMTKGQSFHCDLRGPNGAHASTTLLDHGSEQKLGASFGDGYTVQLLRSSYERASGVGLEEKLRLALLPSGSDEPVAQTLLAGKVSRIALRHAGVHVTCRR